MGSAGRAALWTGRWAQQGSSAAELAEGAEGGTAVGPVECTHSSAELQGQGKGVHGVQLPTGHPHCSQLASPPTFQRLPHSLQTTKVVMGSSELRVCTWGGPAWAQTPLGAALSDMGGPQDNTGGREVGCKQGRPPAGLTCV